MLANDLKENETEWQTKTCGIHKTERRARCNLGHQFKRHGRVTASVWLMQRTSLWGGEKLWKVFGGGGAEQVFATFFLSLNQVGLVVTL